ncbi:OmpA family protein [Flavobacterium gelidilacus]|uniref:OmpA family protein n=1 Tax=Flavobacterium gelidilacus TaxID=206041 RepID=UPI00047C5414|nr:OmpA family protein [Flavobacterium gelidilacus]
MKFKNIISLIILFCSFLGNSQSKVTEGEILISEENLINLIQKIRDKRDANYLLSQKTNIVTTIKSEVDLTEVNSKLIALESELKYLTKILESKSISKETSTEFYIIENPEKEIQIKEKIVNRTDTVYRPSETIYKTQEVYKNPTEIYKSEKALVVRDNDKSPKIAKNKEPINTKTTIAPVVANSSDSKDSYVKAIERLERKIDSLFATNKAIKEIVYVNNNQKPNELNTKTDTVYIMKNNISNYDLLKSKFSDFQEKVYFNNNSSKIEIFENIDSIISLLNSNENLDLYLKGFASNRGNATYNQALSFKRTEVIKRYLISKGIHPSRILSQFHGIDYESINEKEARRVELSFIIRK